MSISEICASRCSALISTTLTAGCPTVVLGSPGSTFTCATTPSNGARISACSRVICASSSAACACATPAAAAADCASRGACVSLACAACACASPACAAASCALSGGRLSLSCVACAWATCCSAAAIPLVSLCRAPSAACCASCKLCSA